MKRVGWVLDLDGVMWRGAEPITGSAEAVRRIREAGARVLFVTNNAYAAIGTQLQRFADMGITTDPEDLVTSAQVAARAVESGQTVLVVGGPGLHEAVLARGATVVTRGRAEAVVVGLHRQLTYDDLSAAHSAIRDGARFIATNTDAAFPTPEGDVPGAGAIVAAVSTSTGKRPLIAGKPHPLVVAYIKERIGQPVVSIGDRNDTDGLLSIRLECPFGLVLSGVETQETVAALNPKPDFVAANLAELTTVLLENYAP